MLLFWIITVPGRTLLFQVEKWRFRRTINIGSAPLRPNSNYFLFCSAPSQNHRQTDFHSVGRLPIPKKLTWVVLIEEVSSEHPWAPLESKQLEQKCGQLFLSIEGHHFKIRFPYHPLHFDSFWDTKLLSFDHPVSPSFTNWLAAQSYVCPNRFSVAYSQISVYRITSLIKTTNSRFPNNNSFIKEH